MMPLSRVDDAYIDPARRIAALEHLKNHLEVDAIGRDDASNWFLVLPSRICSVLGVSSNGRSLASRFIKWIVHRAVLLSQLESDGPAIPIYMHPDPAVVATRWSPVGAWLNALGVDTLVRLINMGFDDLQRRFQLAEHASTSTSVSHAISILNDIGIATSVEGLAVPRLDLMEDDLKQAWVDLSVLLSGETMLTSPQTRRLRSAVQAVLRETAPSELPGPRVMEGGRLPHATAPAQTPAILNSPERPAKSAKRTQRTPPTAPDTPAGVVSLMHMGGVITRDPRTPRAQLASHPERWERLRELQSPEFTTAMDGNTNMLNELRSSEVVAMYQRIPDDEEHNERWRRCLIQHMPRFDEQLGRVAHTCLVADHLSNIYKRVPTDSFDWVTEFRMHLPEGAQAVELAANVRSGIMAY